MMKKIANISQTHSLRPLDIQRFVCDENMILLNELDLVTFSFHSCHIDYFNKWSNFLKSKIDKIKIFRFNNDDYYTTIIKQLEYFNNNGITDFIFWQPDHYIVNTPGIENIIKSLLTFYKNSDCKYFNSFGGVWQELNRQKHINQNNVYTDDNIDIFKVSSLDFKDTNLSAFTDENYITNVKFITDTLFSKLSVLDNLWVMEKKCNDIFISQDIDRYMTNKFIFARASIYGVERSDKWQEQVNNDKILASNINCCIFEKKDYENK